MYEYDPTPFRGVFEREFGYLAGVARNASRFADRPALGEAEGERNWTYAELWRDVERLAAEFAARGVRPGQTVVFQLFNGPEFALTWLAAMRLGAVATPINYRLSAGETAHVIDDSVPAAFIFDAELAPGAREALALASTAPAGPRSSARTSTGSSPGRSPAPSRPRHRPPTATSTARRPASTPRARPDCRRGSRSTTWSR